MGNEALKQTFGEKGLAFMFAASLCFACPAQAADADPPKDQASADSPSTLRTSIDNAKATWADKLYGLQVTVFGDALTGLDDSGKQKLNWGSLELDLSKDFSDTLQGAVAIVRSQDSDETLATNYFLDYRTYGGSIAPRGRLWVEQGFHIEAGQFDVPFGNDWQFYASKDSVSISRPMTTDLVMDGGYNDKGMRVLGNNGSVNFNAFLLHGFNPGRLVGGRVGLTPFSAPFSLKDVQAPKTLELGFSYLYDASSNWRKTETAIAADGELHRDNWTGRFEYLVRNKQAVFGAQGLTRHGWHFTQEYTLGEAVSWPTTLFTRYEQAASAGDERDARISAGFSSNIRNSNVFQWKFEVQHFLTASPASNAVSGFGRSVIWYSQWVVVL